jgi:uncharacterized protein (TIGR03643 family)
MRVIEEKMRIKFSQKLATLTPGDVSAVIQMAWEDRTSFESIKERVGLSESDVVRLMRHELSPSSYQLWRMRMKGRVTKHRALRSPSMKFDDRMIANHRRANC